MAHPRIPLRVQLISTGRSSTSYPPYIRTRFAARAQSTATSSPHTSRRPRPLPDLASLAPQQSLLIDPKPSNPASFPSPGRASSRPPSTTTDFTSTPPARPRPLLKANPYVSSYTVSEAELGEELDMDEAVDVEEAQALITHVSHIAGQHGEPLESRASTSKSPGEFKTDQGGVVRCYLDHITVQEPGWAHPSVITYARLRDECNCNSCLHVSTRQKTFTTADAYRDAHLLSSWPPAVERYTGQTHGGLVITWPTLRSNLASMDNTRSVHKSYYPWRKLRDKATSSALDRLYKTPTFSRKIWDRRKILRSDDLFIPFTELASSVEISSDVLLRLLTQLQVYGIAFLRGVPTDRTSNEDCLLRTVANYIGVIRNTFYGETWDVKSVKQSKNVAYTDLDLGLHMDLLYFSSPPRFQMLHCLRNRVNGGLSYFVDSFRVAFDLKQEEPDTAHLLQQNKITYIYDNDDHFLRHRHPVIDPKFDLSDPHTAVNWSPPFRGSSQGFAPRKRADRDSDKEASYEKAVYGAISMFEHRLTAPRYRYQYQLQEGDMVLFDNRRVLHARTAFHDMSEEEREAKGIALVEGEPTRWLKGCYLDGEAVWDKLAVLRRKRAEAKAASAQSTIAKEDGEEIE